MTPDEIKLDCYRSWLLCLAMIRCDCDVERAMPLFTRWTREHGVA